MKILHLEDNDFDAELVNKALSAGLVDCKITLVKTRRAYEEALARGDWAIILADHSLPSYDGHSALKLAFEKCPDVPFIFVTGTMGEEVGVESLKEGAADYVLKHHLNRLPRAVERARRDYDTAVARKATAQKIKDALDEKAMLLQEVHHRVNNNLQIMCSMLGAQLQSTANPAIATALQENLNRIHSMALVHSMLYREENLMDINFAEYVQIRAAEAFNSYSMNPARVRLAFKLHAARFQLDEAICCGLILNELMSNVCKHAFPDDIAGEVLVSLNQEESGVLLTVEDNGVGLPEDHRSDGAGGLRMVKLLIKQLGGTLETSSGRGCRFDVRFTPCAASETTRIRSR